LPSSTADNADAVDPDDTEILLLDAQTLKDLEIFSAQNQGASLFEFCNLTQTEGGAKVLRQRMERPWSKPQRIQATQQAIAFILAHRRAFNGLPSAYITSRVEYYAHEILPIVTQENPFEFGLGAFALRANHARYYSNIVRGAQNTCRLILALRRLLAQAELASPTGDLAPAFSEMQALLARPRFALIPEQLFAGRTWKMLRMDQVFRIHEKATIARLLQLIYEIDALIEATAWEPHYATLTPVNPH